MTQVDFEEIKIKLNFLNVQIIVIFFLYDWHCMKHSDHHR